MPQLMGNINDLFEVQIQYPSIHQKFAGHYRAQRNIQHDLQNVTAVHKDEAAAAGIKTWNLVTLGHLKKKATTNNTVGLPEMYTEATT